MSLNLYRLESDDATIGGVLFVFPSGLSKKVTWQHAGRIHESLDMAKKLVTELIAHLHDTGRTSDIEAMNVASCIAACQKHIKDWNATHPAIQLQ